MSQVVPEGALASQPIELLKEYRKLDDTINMRLNRTTAQFRDRDRISSYSSETVQDQTCAYMWKELVGQCFSEALSLQGSINESNGVFGFSQLATKTRYR
jgi:hypothetical protein